MDVHDGGRGENVYPTAVQLRISETKKGTFLLLLLLLLLLLFVVVVGLLLFVVLLLLFFVCWLILLLLFWGEGGVLITVSQKSIPSSFEATTISHVTVVCCSEY